LRFATLRSWPPLTHIFGSGGCRKPYTLSLLSFLSSCSTGRLWSICFLPTLSRTHTLLVASSLLLLLFCCFLFSLHSFLWYRLCQVSGDPRPIPPRLLSFVVDPASFWSTAYLIDRSRSFLSCFRPFSQIGVTHYDPQVPVKGVIPFSFVSSVSSLALFETEC